MQPGIRCGKQNITPAPGVWDYDGRDMGGKTMSISVFQWVQSADASAVKPGKEVRHFSGLSEKKRCSVRKQRGSARSWNTILISLTALILM